MEKIETVQSIRGKAEELGISVPKAVWILPHNFFALSSASCVLYEEDYELLVKLFRINKVPYSLIAKSTERYDKSVNHSLELMAIPIIVFTLSLLKENPGIVSTSLSPLVDFLNRRSRTQLGGRNLIRVTVVKEKPHDSKQYRYEGPVEGFSDFVKLVQEDRDG